MTNDNNEEVEPLATSIDNGEKPFRGRHLSSTLDEKIWEHNTWDEIPWTNEQELQVDSLIHQQYQNAPSLTHSSLEEHYSQAFQKWNKFYSSHDRWFFKDRKWLPLEFPEIFSNHARQIWEVGCGAGNTIYPILKARIQNTKNVQEHESTEQDVFKIFASDFSQKAIDLVKSFREYDPSYLTIFQYDLTSEELPTEHIPLQSLDIIMAIFVLSAIPPLKLPVVLEKFYRLLKPGGILLFRDYGRGDLTQLRFKPQRVLDAERDFYQRGDGTDVHFFTQEECLRLAENAGFVVLQNITDRRVIVNRLRKLTMFRVWQQGKYQKPLLDQR